MTAVARVESGKALRRANFVAATSRVWPGTGMSTATDPPGNVTRPSTGATATRGARPVDVGGQRVVVRARQQRRPDLAREPSPDTRGSSVKPVSPSSERSASTASPASRGTTWTGLVAARAR